MTTGQTRRRGFLPLVLGLVVTAVACTTVGTPDPQAEGSGQSEPSGSELWGQTCNRCHNYRSPASLTDKQWRVAMMHMRIRAKLNGKDQRAILKYLKASN